MTRSTQSKVNRQTLELSDVTKQNAKGKVTPVLVTPTISINGILMTLVWKVPSAYIIQSGQKRCARVIRSGKVKNRALSTLATGALVDLSILIDQGLR